MRYQEAQAFLYSLKGLGMRLTLDRMERFCELLGHPEKRIRAVHVAGTNGKGSTSAALASIFQVAGLRTGLYTSPHLVDLRERIQMNRALISEEAFAAAVERALPAWKALEKEGAPPTFFELMTALAFDYFADQKVDIAVIETGLGGRLDATNVIEKPLACVMTSIGLDHERILGGTLAQIAHEKAGIFKEGALLFAADAPPEVHEVLEGRAHKLGLEVEFVPPARKISLESQNGQLKQRFECGDAVYETSLLGTHQLQNLALAIHTTRGLQKCLMFSDEAIQQGIAEAKWAGRFDVIGSDPWWILDGAHNADGLKNACAAWMESIGAPPGRVIFGALGDKQFETMAEVLDAWADDLEIWLVPIDSDRALDPQKLVPYFTRNQPRVLDSAADACTAQHEKPHLRGTFLLGSLYLVGEALRWLRERGLH